MLPGDVALAGRQIISSYSCSYSFFCSIYADLDREGRKRKSTSKSKRIDEYEHL
jgi:hypothetical protein